MATDILNMRPSGADTQRVLVALRERTIRESQPYKELITSHAKLIEYNDTLRRKQRELELDVSDLQQNLTNLTTDSPARGKGDTRKEVSCLRTETKLIASSGESAAETDSSERGDEPSDFSGEGESQQTCPISRGRRPTTHRAGLTGSGADSPQRDQTGLTGQAETAGDREGGGVPD